MTAIAYATAAAALLRAVRRAWGRGDTIECGRLLDEADGQLAAMIEALPDDQRPRA